MTRGEQLDMLRRARGLLWKVAGSLDASTTLCEGCGLMRRVNWTESQLHEQLVGMTDRLVNVERKLANSTGAPQRAPRRSDGTDSEA